MPKILNFQNIKIIQIWKISKISILENSKKFRFGKIPILSTCKIPQISNLKNDENSKNFQFGEE